MHANKYPAFFLLVAALVLFLVYHNSFQNSFHYDDIHSIVDNPHIRDPGNVPAFFHRPEMFSGMQDRAMYRPLVLVSYGFNYWLGEYQLQGYHLVNLAIHVLCALLVYLLGRALGGEPIAAGLGALVFALHPVHAEAVNYISSRSESLAAFWYLCGLLAYLHWRQVEPGESRRAALCYGLSLLAFICGLLSKSITITFPAVLLWYEMVRPGRRQIDPRWRSLLPYHLGYWGIVAGYILLIRSWVQNTLSSPVRPLEEQLLTQFKAAVYYLQLLAMPVRLSVEHPFEAARSLWSVSVLLALVLLVSTLLALGYSRSRFALLLAGWCVLALLPASLVPLNVLVNEHRLYLPVALLSSGLVLWWRGVGPARGQMLLCGVFLLVLGGLAHQRNPVWKDELSLWGDAVRKAPGMYRSHMHLGNALEQQGRFQEALVSFQRAARQAPEVVEVYYNVGNALRQLGRVQEAIAAYEKSLELNSGFVHSLINLSSLYREIKQLKRAEELLLQARQVQPESGEIFRQLGVVYKDQGRGAEAEAAFLRAIELLPQGAEAYYNLANLYYDRGQYPVSMRYYQQAIAQKKDHVRAHNNLGLLYFEQEEYERAVEVFSQGLRQAPGGVILYRGLALAQDALGQGRAALLSYQRYLQYASVYPDVEERIRLRMRELKQGAKP